MVFPRQLFRGMRRWFHSVTLCAATGRASLSRKRQVFFSWLMSNYWGTNFAPQQGGDFTFRYDIVSSASFDAAQLTRTGWDKMTPLENGSGVRGVFFPGALPATQGKFLEIDNSKRGAVYLEARGGWAGHDSPATGNFRKRAVRPDREPIPENREAWNCSALEVKETSLDVLNSAINLTLRPFEIKTIRLQTSSLLTLRRIIPQVPGVKMSIPLRQQGGARYRRCEWALAWPRRRSSQSLARKVGGAAGRGGALVPWVAVRALLGWDSGAAGGGDTPQAQRSRKSRAKFA